MPVKKGLTQLYDAKTYVMEALASQVKQSRLQANQTLTARRRTGATNESGLHYSNKDIQHSLFSAVRLTQTEKLWLAVIEQAIFDAYLHATGGNYQSVIWVKDAREYFDCDDFNWACEQIEIEPDWVRRLLRVIERMARELRGDEYEEALVADHVEPPQAEKRNTNQRTFDYG